MMTFDANRTMADHPRRHSCHSLSHRTYRQHLTDSNISSLNVDLYHSVEYIELSYFEVDIKSDVY